VRLWKDEVTVIQSCFSAVSLVWESLIEKGLHVMKGQALWLMINGNFWIYVLLCCLGVGEHEREEKGFRFFADHKMKGNGLLACIMRGLEFSGGVSHWREGNFKSYG
jgi:hypothetical protein